MEKSRASRDMSHGADMAPALGNAATGIVFRGAKGNAEVGGNRLISDQACNDTPQNMRGKIMANEDGEGGDPKANWERIKARLLTELGEDVFNSWFARMDFESTQNGVVLLSVPTKFLRSWVTEHYKQRIEAHWHALDPSAVTVEIVLRRPKPMAQAAAAQTQPEAPARRDTPVMDANAALQPLTSPSALPSGNGIASPLDPRLTFHTFRVGRSNSVAHAAAKQVATARPGDAAQFNPFYVHATVGRGKTHMLQAIAAHVQGEGSMRVLYLTAERFMYRFVAALKSDGALPFKDHLRSIDILLIDDMQFLGGKSIQQEFSHTLNALLDGGQQVVVAADRPPVELEGLDDRVRSRLAGGLVVEIGAPDLPLRREILHARIDQARRIYPNFSISEEAIDLIANRVNTNGRDLEGVFNRLLAQNQFGETSISAELIEETIQGHVKFDEPRRIKIDDIQKIVAQHFNVSRADLLSNRRNRAIVRPRQIAMYLAKIMTPRSLPEIGRRFGGRDHTTVLHAVRKIESLMQTDQVIASDIDQLRRFLQD